jgi:hypothetical protein
VLAIQNETVARVTETLEQQDHVLNVNRVDDGPIQFNVAHVTATTSHVQSALNARASRRSHSRIVNGSRSVFRANLVVGHIDHGHIFDFFTRQNAEMNLVNLVNAIVVVFHDDYHP